VRVVGRGSYRGLALAAALACFALVPATASAATSLGQTSPPSSCDGGTFEGVQIATGNPPSYAVPAGGGVITSWSQLASPALTQSAKLKLWRPTGAALTFRVVGASDLRALSPSVLNTFPTRIPVQSGDLVGLGWTAPVGPSQVGCQFSTSSPGDQFGGHPGDTPTGGETSFGSGSNFRINVSATLEPDADNDGFGDETQDGCPTDNTAQGACPVPDTTITKGPKDKTKKKTATLEFSSSLDGSTFECSVDGKPFAACASPHTIKVAKGKHSFAVRAVRKGQTDATPATDTWKVKKKKKKKK